jgi:type VI secretion system secreted protein VgrG
MALKQDNRLLGLATPLGENALVLTAFRGREAISRLFHFELFLLSDNNAVSAKDIVGKNVTFHVKLDDGAPRPFNGFVSRFYAGDEDENGRRSYRAVVVPWLWFTSLKTDCRIFQNQTVPEITEKLFGELGFNDFDAKQIKGHHPKRVYCVQYNESTFAFLSRLWEDEGIFYFFAHEDGKHTLKLGDQKQAYIDCVQQEVDFPRRFGAKREEDVITRWEHRWEFRTGKVAQTDYNFETPSNSLMTGEATVIDVPGMDAFEQYEWPGAYGTTDDGQPLARVRIEEHEAGFDVVEALSHCRTFTPGGKFKIRKHRSPAEEGKSFVITAIEHSAAEPGAYESDMPGGEGYTNEFECIPDAVVFRPPRHTPRPFSRGPETAVVVGPSGEELYTDEFGRVKVQFHWDREGQRDENSSCWLRVSQVHAGKGFGGIDIPRIGEEVIVEYIGGNYDYPIITGRVYNAENMPPTSLPGAAVVSGIQSDTVKGSGNNQLYMDSTAGKENFVMHGQHNMNTTVGNNQNNTVSIDQTNNVGSNQTEEIGAKRETKVGADDKETVGANRETSIGANKTESVTGKDDQTIGGSSTQQVGGMRSQTVAGPHSIANPMMNIGTARAYTVAAGSKFTGSSPKMNMLAGSKMLSSSGGKMDVKAGAKLTQQSGAAMDIKSGAKLSQQSSAAMNIKSGAALSQQSSAAMNIKSGAALNQQAGAAMNLKSAGDLNSKGSNIKLKSTTKIKGTTLVVS